MNGLFLQRTDKQCCKQNTTGEPWFCSCTLFLIMPRSQSFGLFAAETMVIITRGQRAEGPPAADITGWYQTGKENCFSTYTAKTKAQHLRLCWALTDYPQVSGTAFLFLSGDGIRMPVQFIVSWCKNNSGQSVVTAAVYCTEPARHRLRSHSS